MRVDRLIKFIVERQQIYLRRAAGDAPPWTCDPILRRYRFCNVYREQDAVTVWISKNWRTPMQNNPQLWFAMCVARLFNLPSTLARIQPLPWRPDSVFKTLEAARSQGHKIFNAAYIVSTNGCSMDKLAYVVYQVLHPLWLDRKKIVLRGTDSLRAFHTCLQEYNGMGSFLAAQIVADAKYALPLNKAPDWHTFAASGPGSRRGLNRVLGRPEKTPWREDDWFAALTELRAKVNPQLVRAKMEPLHAQDLQNCLCEFDKYERARKGEGQPKQLYRGGG